MPPSLPSPISRRRFLRDGSLFVGGLAAATPLHGLFARLASASFDESPIPGPYGPVSPVADATTGLELLQLPRGFRYASFGWTGDTMVSGGPTPADHDGMGVVQTLGGRGRRSEIVLVRNHESALGALVGAGTAPTYDDGFSVAGVLFPAGGCTRLRFRGGRWLSAEPVLAGTEANCAGGITPWGSWLSNEEVIIDLRPGGGEIHGYVFEVPGAGLGPASAQPIRDMGLMRHEATAVDPATGFVYATEDSNPVSGLYRYRPDDTSGEVGSLEKGGTLDMLKVVGEFQADLDEPSQGEVFDVEWVTIPEPDRLPDTGAPLYLDIPSSPYSQGRDLGAARFKRLEGCMYFEGLVYFVDTSAGAGGNGVIWCYDPVAEKITALFVARVREAGDNPDNLTVSPRGGILFCEDGNVDGARLMGVTQDGCSFEFARNNVLLDGPVPGRPGFANGDFRAQEWSLPSTPWSASSPSPGRTPRRW